MSRRRSLTGRPLLVASAGLLLSTRCGGSKPPIVEPVGNLMAPAEISVSICLDVVPADAEATVTVGGTVATERCTTVHCSYGASVPVLVMAPTYASQALEAQCTPDAAPLAVILAPDVEPVGNLMPPQ